MSLQDLKTALVECPKCKEKRRIRISAYPFEEILMEQRKQGTEVAYVAEGLHHKCSAAGCNATWRKITLYEYPGGEKPWGIAETDE